MSDVPDYRLVATKPWQEVQWFPSADLQVFAIEDKRPESATEGGDGQQSTYPGDEQSFKSLLGDITDVVRDVVWAYSTGKFSYEGERFDMVWQPTLPCTASQSEKTFYFREPVSGRIITKLTVPRITLSQATRQEMDKRFEDLGEVSTGDFAEITFDPEILDVIQQGNRILALVQFYPHLFVVEISPRGVKWSYVPSKAPTHYHRLRMEDQLIVDDGYGQEENRLDLAGTVTHWYISQGREIRRCGVKPWSISLRAKVSWHLETKGVLLVGTGVYVHILDPETGIEIHQLRVGGGNAFMGKWPEKKSFLVSSKECATAFTAAGQLTAEIKWLHPYRGNTCCGIGNLFIATESTSGATEWTGQFVAGADRGVIRNASDAIRVGRQLWLCRAGPDFASEEDRAKATAPPTLRFFDEYGHDYTDQVQAAGLSGRQIWQLYEPSALNAG